MFGVERLHRLASQPGQALNAFLPTGRALVDGGLALCNGLGVAVAIGVATALALGLGQGLVDARGQVRPFGWGQGGVCAEWGGHAWAGGKPVRDVGERGNGGLRGVFGDLATE